jgi:phosphatidylserine decarboxylase
MKYQQHQYIERDTFRIKTEKFYGDKILKLVYSKTRENAPVLFRALMSHRVSSLLGFLNYDLPLGTNFTGIKRFIKILDINFSECLDNPESLNTARKIFERKVKYWETRPMPDDPAAILSPADSKVLVGSFRNTSQLFLKGKFFDFNELLGVDKKEWLRTFYQGDFAIFRLTPEKYHYNHTPVAGNVVDIYQIPGGYHSCNPSAVVNIVTPLSKNKRVVTVIDTDVDGGTKAGLVAMIEIVALMIGDITQCYSENKYDSPQNVIQGMFLQKGQPKSLFRPGSSTDVLIFQKGRIKISQDLVTNMYNQEALSRYSLGFGKPLVETEVNVRSKIAFATF